MRSTADIPKRIPENTRLTLGISISDHLTVPWQFAESVIKLISKYPSIAVLRAHGSLIHDNRNWLIKNTKADRMLMVDTDMVFTPEMVESVMTTMDETGADIVGGAYRSGYHPHKWNLFDKELERVQELEIVPFEIGAIGMGFTLIDKKAMAGETPFDPIMDAEVRHGEDVSFCIRTRQRGLKILCDPRVKPDHLRLQPVCE